MVRRSRRWRAPRVTRQQLCVAAMICRTRTFGRTDRRVRSSFSFDILNTAFPPSLTTPTVAGPWYRTALAATAAACTSTSKRMLPWRWDAANPCWEAARLVRARAIRVLRGFRCHGHAQGIAGLGCADPGMSLRQKPTGGAASCFPAAGDRFGS